jgi:hypothetical protein
MTESHVSYRSPFYLDACVCEWWVKPQVHGQIGHVAPARGAWGQLARGDQVIANIDTMESNE